MKIKGNIDILGDEDGVRIRVYDDAAATVICEVILTPEEFCKAALGRLSKLKCDVTVPAPDRIGKVRETLEHEFKMPDKDQWQSRFGASNQREAASKFIETNCPDGWTPSTYFGSKDSFFWKNDELWARTTIMRFNPRGPSKGATASTTDLAKT